MSKSHQSSKYKLTTRTWPIPNKPHGQHRWTSSANIHFRTRNRISSSNTNNSATRETQRILETGSRTERANSRFPSYYPRKCPPPTTSVMPHSARRTTKLLPPPHPCRAPAQMPTTAALFRIHTTASANALTATMTSPGQSGLERFCFAIIAGRIATCKARRYG